MQYFEIIGGKKLGGEITPQGSKNEALQILSACLLTTEELRIQNVPDIIDIRKHLTLLESIGVKIKHNADFSYTLKADTIDPHFYEKKSFIEASEATRGSITILGALSHRVNEFKFYKPGGDSIGQRHIDTHIKSLEKLGISFSFDKSNRFFHMRASKVIGTYILMEEASVTATANLIMASVKAQGKTTIYNAACEPYIQQLCILLTRMGAKIAGIGSNLLNIEGVSELKGASHTILPDMIEVGSFIAIAMATRSKITIKNCQVQHLGIMPSVFEKLGGHVVIQDDDIVVDGTKNRPIGKNLDNSILKIDDAPWPGLSPDMLSMMLVCAVTLKGTVLFHQKMFESRLFFVDKLINMGAQIILCDPHRATVIGLDSENALHSITMNSPDIRAGISLLIAALCANGKSVIHNIAQIDRGYTQIEKRLNALGASITRVDEENA